MKKDYCLAKVTRLITQRVRIYTREDMARLRKAFAKHLHILPSAYTTRQGVEAFIAKVPVVTTSVIPETPEVITIGRETFVRVNESPLTYRVASTRKATRR